LKKKIFNNILFIGKEKKSFAHSNKKIIKEKLFLKRIILIDIIKKKIFEKIN
jgi:hypothetical protein